MLWKSFLGNTVDTLAYQRKTRFSDLDSSLLLPTTFMNAIAFVPHVSM